MPFDIVVAHDLNNGIGINNQLPWKCTPDMEHFKKLTSEQQSNQLNTVIMGRKTWESIPEKFRPLPNRTNIVISKSITEAQGAIIATSFAEALSKVEPKSQAFVIGGAQIYNEAIQHPECETLHITKIFKDCNCDVYFPSYLNGFYCTYASNIWVTNTVNCSFFQFKKINQ